MSNNASGQPPNRREVIVSLAAVVTLPAFGPFAAAEPLRFVIVDGWVLAESDLLPPAGQFRGAE